MLRSSLSFLFYFLSYFFFSLAVHSIERLGTLLACISYFLVYNPYPLALIP